VTPEVGIDRARRDLEEEFPDFLALEYHEKCRDPDKCPVRDSSPDSTHEGDTPCSDRSDLGRNDGLDITCILLDDIEGVFDVTLSEYEEYSFLDIGVELESSNSLSEIDCLCRICPVDDDIDRVGYIIHDDRYESPDNDTPEDKYDDINPNYWDPRGDIVPFSYFGERIDQYRDKSRYHEHEH
jgi:hypothetical protein